MEKIKNTRLKFLVLVVVVMLVVWLMPAGLVYGEEPDFEDTHIEASPSSDWIALNSFWPGTIILVKIYDEEGSLIGETSKTTDEHGWAQIEQPEHGVDLQPGMRIITRDSETDLERELLIDDVTLDDIDFKLNLVTGSADPGQEVQVVVYGKSFDDGYIMKVFANSLGNWTADFTSMGGIAPEKWAAAMTFDADRDVTVVEYNPPNIAASLTNDWIKLWSFDPGEDVQLEIVDFWSGNVPTDGDGDAEVLGLVHLTDIVPGTHIIAEGLVSGIIKDLVVADLTMDVFDLEDDIIYGTGPPDEWVYLNIGNESTIYEIWVLVPDSGNWSANFGDEGLVEGMGGRAVFFDEERDSTIVESETEPPPPQPGIVASLTHDWIDLWGFAPEEVVELEIVDFWSQDVTVDESGHLWLEGWEHGVDIVPGMHITATGSVSELKELYVEDLSLDIYFLESNIVNGTGPADGKYMVGVGDKFNQYEMEVQADSNGDWFADFNPIDLVRYMLPWALNFDGNGNGTMVEAECPYSIIYTGDTLVQYPNQIRLSAEVEPKGDPGDVSTLENVIFEVFKGDDIFLPETEASVDWIEGETVGTAVHILYDVPIGVYEVVATVDCDFYGNRDKAVELLAVYDPSGGFATGGGWFIPEGNQDKVNFGFELKYKNDGTLKGNLEMIDHSTGDKYKATDFSFLVIVDNKAYFMGHVMINGEGSHPFMAIMEDNGTPGKNSDKFSISIQIEKEQIAFDEVIDNGNIVIHK